MENYYGIIKKSPLFYGITSEELPTMLHCLAAEQEVFEEEEFVMRKGETVSRIAMVLRGSVRVTKEDFWGNPLELGRKMAGDLFAESFACSQTAILPVNVLALESCEVLFMDYKRMTHLCAVNCEFHVRMLQNVMKILSEENLKLSQKMEHMAKKTTRDKLLSYLSDISFSEKSRVFEIPYNRQELAEFLAVDRSAMSNELSKLKKEGVLNFHKNRFELFD